MKIGILTMNYLKNYGGILQVYGLSQWLKTQGHIVQIINYENSGGISISGILTNFEKFLTRTIRGRTSVIPRKQLSENYLQNFIDFRKSRLEYTEKVNEYTIAKVCKDFDAIIIGSDQIWNGVNTNKLIYYFDWIFNGKRIAYAACTILKKSPLIRRCKIRRLLNEFDSITVRDENTANYVEQHCLQKPEIVVDPSCFYEYQDCIGVNPIGKPYILTYILSNEISGGNSSAIKIIKKEIGDLPVVSVCIPSVSTVSESISDIFFEEATPAEWINLFYHASFVYTDSFHGIMFAMKFRKQFIAYMKDESRKSRLHDLINRYDMNNIVTNVNQISKIMKNEVIDYQKITPILSSLVIQSQKLLLSALNG